MLNSRALDRMRPLPVYLMAAAVPVSMAVTSLSKALILIFGLIVTLGALREGQAKLNTRLREFLSVRLVLWMLCLLAFSISYSDAAWPLALGDWGKYGKLVMLPVILLLLRSVGEGMKAITILLTSQSFVLLSSCLLGLGWDLPWVPNDRNALATVYSSYLDQAIMTAGFAAMCWHLRSRLLGQHGTWIAAALALLAFLNVLFLLPGRSGQLAMLAAAVLAMWWALPPRWRVLIIAAPFVLSSIAALNHSKFNERMGLVVEELQSYHHNNDITTSTGIRLNFWHRSLQAIIERPLTGYGVGSWSKQFLRLEGPQASLGVSPRSNPHQEYLQWGVQLGIGGMVLLVALMVSLALDARRFQTDARRAAQSLAVVFAVACLFNSSLFDALIGDYFCVVLGILLAFGAADVTANTADKSPALAETPSP